MFSTATMMIPWPLITAIRLTGPKFIVINGLLYIQHQIWAGTVCHVRVSASYPNGLLGMCCHVKLFDYLLQAAHAILCRKSSPEELAWSLLRVLITIASSNGIFLCRLQYAFYKRLATAFGNKAHENMNTMIFWFFFKGKNLILTFPRFSCSRIIRVYCSLKEIRNNFVMNFVWFFIIQHYNIKKA